MPVAPARTSPRSGRTQPADDALDRILNNAVGQRFHNHSPLDFEKLKGDPDHIEAHLVSYIKGFSANVRTIFDFFEFETEIDKMREANILYLVVSNFCDVDLHPNTVPNEQMGLIFENSSAVSTSWPTRPLATTSPRARSSG
jgi:type I restriction enzyme M protein